MTAQTQPQEEQFVNGVNVSALSETIEAIQETPQVASFKFQTKNSWVEGALNRSEISGFYGACEEQPRAKAFTLENDEPPLLLGEDRAANPVEYVLHALAGCMTTTMVYHAALRGISIESVESKFIGDLDLQGFLGLNDRVRNGYENIEIEFSVKADATPEEIEELCQITKDRSVVLDIIQNKVPVSISFQQ